MLTTRKAELDPDNKLILTTKADIELSNTKRKSLNMGTTQEEIKAIRTKMGRPGELRPGTSWAQ